MDTTAQIWILTAQSTNLEFNNCFLGWNECEILTHSHQLPQVPNTDKKKPTIRLTTRVKMLWAPQGSLLYKLLVTEFRQPLQVQSHLEMPRTLVQLGHTQRT